MINTHPLYSVLMPVYKKDNVNWIKEAVDSMLYQSVTPSEFIIIQDGPVPKEIESLINNYINMYPNLFKLLVNDKNLGLGESLRKGVLACTYEYIARMDADDISNTFRCEKILEYMVQNPELSLVGSDCIEFIDKINNIQGYVRLPNTPEAVNKFAKQRVPIRHPSIIFKKSDVLKVGNYKPILRSQEYDLVVRMIMDGMKIANIPEILFYIRVGEDFYSRRGGLDKALLLAKQRRDFYKYGFYKFYEYIFYASINIGVCLMPNYLRAFIYKTFLRKNTKRS